MTVLKKLMTIMWCASLMLFSLNYIEQQSFFKVPASITVCAADSVTLDIVNGDIVITTTGYSVGGESETAYTGEYVITGTATNRTITIKSGDHTITLDNVYMDNTGCGYGIMIESGTTNLKFKGECTVIAGGWEGDWVPIGVQASATLVLSGAEENESILNVIGTSDGKAAIGGAWDQYECGTIIINSGTINAVGGGNGAAVIGSGGNISSSGQVIINGGIIKCTLLNDDMSVSGRQATEIGGDGMTTKYNGGIVNGTNYGGPIYYTVTIPSKVNLVEEMTIQASNVFLNTDQTLSVTISGASGIGNALTLNNSDGDEITYTISNGDRQYDVGDTVLSTTTDADVTLRFEPEKVIYSGEYSGTVTFSISVD